MDKVATKDELEHGKLGKGGWEYGCLPSILHISRRWLSS